MDGWGSGPRNLSVPKPSTWVEGRPRDVIRTTGGESVSSVLTGTDHKERVGVSSVVRHPSRLITYDVSPHDRKRQVSDSRKGSPTPRVSSGWGSR